MVGMASWGPYVKALGALFVDKRYINAIFNLNFI